MRQFASGCRVLVGSPTLLTVGGRVSNRSSLIDGSGSTTRLNAYA
ncbi:hypothetical protein [Streptomyces graminofaciens]|jgi:hypothetical protein|nr:hypothetical protein [Streptomyces graminofaciens]